MRLRHSIGYLPLALLLLAPGAAMAATVTAFPPKNASSCSSGGFLGWNGNDSTYCESGQNVMMNANPFCGPYQYLVSDGVGNFNCEYFGGATPVTCPSDLSGAVCYKLNFTTEQ